MKNKIALAFVSVLIVACGGGGGGGDSPSAGTAPTSNTELEGVWVSSTDNHPTGTACGLDSSGGYGFRETVTFSGSKFTYKSETCAILIGNTGGYVLTNSSNGTFMLGGVVVTSNDPSSQLKALDVTTQTTQYTSYNLTGNILHIAGPFQSLDGSTSAKRAIQLATYLDTVTGKLVTNPAFTKQ